MSVRVYFDERDSLTAVDYPDAKRYEATDREVLTVFGPAGRVLATFASGRWYRAEVLPSPDPEPPLLRSGTVVRIPGIDVPYVVDKGLATSGPHATLTFTTVDGRDWSDDRSEPVNAATPLANAEPKARTWSSEVEAVANKVSIDIAHALHEGIADPRVRDLAASMVVVGHDLGVSFGRLDAAFRRIPRRDAEPESATPEPPAGTPADADPNHVLTTTTAEAVLSETTEPYVSVNLSVTSDNSAEVVKVIKEALRTGKLTIPPKALA